MATNLSFIEEGDTIRRAVEAVRAGTDPAWVVTQVVASGEVKLVATGGALEDLAEELSDGAEHFALARVTDPNSGLGKLVLICWCGEGVPAMRKAHFSNHVGQAKQFFSGFHISLIARDEADVAAQAIRSKVADASGAKYSVQNGAAPPVTTTSKPTLATSTPATYVRSTAPSKPVAPPAKPVAAPAVAVRPPSPTRAPQQAPTSPAPEVTTSWITAAISKTSPTGSPRSPRAQLFGSTTNVGSKPGSTTISPSASQARLSPSASFSKPDTAPIVNKEQEQVDERTARQREMDEMIRARQQREADPQEYERRTSREDIAADASRAALSGSASDVSALRAKFSAMSSPSASGTNSPSAGSPRGARASFGSAASSTAPPSKKWPVLGTQSVAPPTAPSTVSAPAPATMPSIPKAQPPTFTAAVLPARDASPALVLPARDASPAPALPARDSASIPSLPKRDGTAAAPALPDRSATVVSPVAPPSAPVADAPQDAGAKYVAQFAWDAQDAEEISMRIGDLVTVVDKLDDAGWWIVEPASGGGNMRGLVPSNYLEAVPASAVVGVFDYEPADVDELEIRVGRVVVDIEKVDENWWQGRTFGTDKTALFPANYVTPV